MKTPAAQISPFGEVLEAEGMLGAHGEAQTRSVWETWSANAVSEAAQSKGGKPTTECECEKSKIKIILSILRPLELLVGRARAVLDKRSAHDRVLEESGGGVLVQQSFQQWKKLSWTFLTLTSPNISSWPSCTWTRQVRLVAIKGRLDRKRATVSWPEHKKKKKPNCWCLCKVVQGWKCQRSPPCLRHFRSARAPRRRSPYRCRRPATEGSRNHGRPLGLDSSKEDVNSEG